MKELRIIVAGSRDFQNYTLLSSTLRRILAYLKNNNVFTDKNQVEFISGTARGADQLGEQFAKQFGYNVKRFPADWTLGKRAGYVRNEQMAKYAVADGNKGLLVAFWDGKSKGTKHMIDLARKHGLAVRVVKYKEIDGVR